MKTRNDRCRDIAYSLGDLQAQARRYAEMPNDAFRTRDLASAAEAFVLSIEGASRSKEKSK